MDGWAVWFVGLPGSGKSSLAGAVFDALPARGLDPGRLRLLRMDERRKAYFPKPDYSDDERARAYALFAREAADLAARGLGVLMDGTAPQRSMRLAARRLIPKFAEILVRCPLGTAMDRERSRPEGLVMADLYDKALERRRTGREVPGLGRMVGVDVPFEEDPAAELTVDSSSLSVAAARDRVLAFLESWLPLPA